MPNDLKKKTANRLAALAAAAATTIALLGHPVSAQPKSAQKSAAQNAPLSSLSDDALFAELAGRNMNGLLNYAFDASNVPKDQRQAMLAIPAITRIGDQENPPRIPERGKLIEQVSAGIDRVMVGVDDPTVLLEYATKLVNGAIDPEAKLLEYWGELPNVKRRLAGATTAAVKLIDKAILVGQKNADALAEQLNAGKNAKIEEQWIAADELVRNTKYTRAFMLYNKALTLPIDAKSMEQRKKIADEGIEFLKDFDDPENTVQATVRNQLGKLHMVKRDFGPANDYFESVETGKIDDKTKVNPPPTPFQQYEARTYGILCELMRGDTDRAGKGLDALVEWQKKTVTDPKALAGLSAGVEVLRYRILIKERDKSKDPAAKQAANDKASSVLTELSQSQPELRPIIAEQLIDMMGDKVDVKTAEPLMLEAVVNRGAQEAQGVEEGAKLDETTRAHVEQAVDAARELTSRKDPKITPQTRTFVAFQVPPMLNKLGRVTDAANALLNLVEKKEGTSEAIEYAFNQAGYLLLNRKGLDRTTPEYSKALERFQPLAIDRFGHTEFAYDYGNRLRSKNPPDLAGAIKYFRMVPPSDGNYPAARYNEMVTLNEWITSVGPDRKPLLDPKQKAEKTQEAMKLAQDVRQVTAEALKTATNKNKETVLRGWIVGVTLTEAELAASGDKSQAERVLTILEGFEQQAAGVPRSAELIKRAMELRFNAYFKRNEVMKATPLLTQLLEQYPGGRAESMVLSILEQLDAEYDRAKAANDIATVKEILKGRADLSGYLVKWATANKDPKVKLQVYRYKLYDADTMRLYGATLEGEERTKQLQKAIQAFQALRSEDNVALRKAALLEFKKENPQDKTDPDQPDPQVTLNLAYASYDLKNWKDAALEIRKLRFAQKLGNRTLTQLDAKTGATRLIPNNQYWEAMYRWYDATRQWAKTSPEDDIAQKELIVVKTLLQRDYTDDPAGAGGQRWRAEFEALRKDLIPELDVEGLKNSDNASSTSQPAPNDAGNSK